MLPNRIAATAQAATTIVVLTTAVYPTGVGFIRGPFVTVWGGAYIAACIAATVRPNDNRAETLVAGIGVTWWVLRAMSIITIHPTPWVGVANPLLIATLVALYYYRSLFRAGFHARLDDLEIRMDELENGSA